MTSEAALAELLDRRQQPGEHDRSGEQQSTMVEIAEVDEQRHASERDRKNDDGESETLVIEQPNRPTPRERAWPRF